MKVFIMVRLFIVSLILISFATPAYAYIDAATGGLILQAIIAGFVGLMVMWRSWVYKVKAFFGCVPPEEEIDEADADTLKKEEQA